MDINNCAESTEQCDQWCMNKDLRDPGLSHTPISQRLLSEHADDDLLMHCRAGLRLGPDGKKCVDIDECAEGTAQCDQQCVNKDPRDSGIYYACTCHNGFSIDIEDQHKCIPKVFPLSVTLLVTDLLLRSGCSSVLCLFAASVSLALERTLHARLLLNKSLENRGGDCRDHWADHDIG